MQIRPTFLACALALAPSAAFACATCGCTLSTDAAAGYSSLPGWRFNLDYSYVDQDRLRTGTRSASPEQIVDRPSDPSLGGGEIEKDTINRYLDLSIAYRPNADWGFALLLPWVSRDHTTFGVQQAPFTPSEIARDQVSGTSLSGIGDIKLLASYQGFLPTHNLGVQVGLKLPTGRYGGETEDGRVVGDPTRFQSGPMIGEALDTSLQAGTGSTDLIVGAYYYRAISQDFDAYVNGQFQAALSHRMGQAGADFRPGNQFTVGAGLKYEANPKWIPQLQVNLLRKSRDLGALADTLDTAGTVAYVSPGVTVSVRQNLQVYGFVQLPFYSNLQGYQLFPRWTASVGLSAGF
jgi:hypothetical protein